MNFDTLIDLARQNGASDLHLEAGLPAGLRIRGTLKLFGEALPPAALKAMARNLMSDEQWAGFLERRSCDLSRTVRGVRCRVNVLATARGVGMAVRLLAPFEATLRKLNLLPDLRDLIEQTNGLVIVTGPTGSGKSTTLAALLQEINLSAPRHIVTIESPIEYTLAPRQAFIRQREVGRDTPSFEQALRDGMREDPDVLVVGEMRDPETMRLTLNAAETGHLVLTTMHSSNAAEALQRVVGSFPAEIQQGVSAQLADCLVAVIAQRLRYRPEQRLRVPECEILLATTAARSVIRQGHFYKIASVIESGGQEGLWTFARYREWLDRRTDWYVPSAADSSAQAPAPVPAPASEPEPLLPPLPAPRRAPAAQASRRPAPASRSASATSSEAEDGVIEIHGQDQDLDEIIQELERR